jgi:hypothetical protein
VFSSVTTAETLGLCPQIGFRQTAHPDRRFSLGLGWFSDRRRR